MVKDAAGVKAFFSLLCIFSFSAFSSLRVFDSWNQKVSYQGNELSDL